MGVLVRSDNLASLNAAGRQAMIDYGVTTVIDLRAESELKGSPGPPFSDFQSTSPVGPSFADGGDAGPTYLNLPLVDDKAALGDEVTIQSLTGGQLQLRVHPESQAGKVFRLKGKGLPALKDGLPGDLYVTLEIRIPEPITPAIHDLYEAIRKARTS